MLHFASIVTFCGVTHPPGRVNFSKRSYEEKVLPFGLTISANAILHVILLSKTALAHALIVSPWPVGWAKVFICRKVGPARRVTLPSQKGDWVGESSFQPSQSLVSHVNASRFKNWISQGSTHGVCRMSLQPKTTFLHITGPYNDSKMPFVLVWLFVRIIWLLDTCANNSR